ncbi:LIM/homeobox protein Lhx9 [Parasteatoda tepidariorum]|nr:LIM/homeobox protein Lhx9 [Parasteatoda tepidariorum]
MVTSHPPDSRIMPVISSSDFDTPPPPNDCAGCGRHIVDRYYLNAVDLQWHVYCLKCHKCKAQLDEELSCFWKDGHIYCKEDYYRLFSSKRCCSRCQQGIHAQELVMRARDLVFHIHCFTCAWCNTALTQGDYFGLRDNLVYCRTHYEMFSRDDTSYYSPDHHPSSLLHPPHHLLTPPGLPSDCGGIPTPDSTPGFYGPYTAGCVNNSDGVPASGRKGRPRKKKNGDLSGSDPLSRHNTGLSPLDPASCNLHLGHLDGTGNSQSSPPLSSGGGGSQRTKRMRTSFKHHQLRTMKSYFAINQNPDAKDLKQLAQKTGLSKRVLQVWFQNARAKWRRNNNKQPDSVSGMITSEQPSTPQLLQGGHMGGGICSPGATSSYSEPSPVHSCGGVASDGSLSTHVGPGASMDFDSSDPMTPLVSHQGLNPGSVHNGDNVSFHVTSFHELF